MIGHYSWSSIRSSGKAGIVVDVEASTLNKAAEVHATQKMIDWVEDQFGMKPKRLVGDTNYDTADILAWLVNVNKRHPKVSSWSYLDGSLGCSQITTIWWNVNLNSNPIKSKTT